MLPGVLELAGTPNIVGMKQAVGALDTDTLEILAGAPRDFSVLGGDDAFLLPTVLMGGAGAIWPSANLCPERFVAMVDCGLAGKVDDGRAHAEALLPVVQAASRSPTRRCSRRCCTRRAGSPRPTCAFPSSARRAARWNAAMAAVEAAR